MTLIDAEATVRIRCDGTVHFTAAATRHFREMDAAYVHFYRVGGGGGTRPLLARERRDLGLNGNGPFSQYGEDDPVEFLCMIQIEPGTRRSYRAWSEPSTRTIMVQIG